MTEVLDRLRTALSDEYAIIRELGGGGMSRVYEADERAFGRRVVIKVLPPDLAADLGAERFRREIQLAARLRHPHIVPLLGAGEAGGLLYYTMPFIEGESLRARLDREQRLPVADAVGVALEVADALGYAHAQGVIHRDIKPDNVLLEGRHAVVADFGIARAVQHSLGNQTLTSAGLALGTPLYMSPEQAGSERDIDGRSDIYSLGCVLFEMLVGEPPFRGSSPQAVIVCHFTETPRRVATLREGVQPRLDEVVANALAKDPKDRYPTAAALMEALSAAAEELSAATMGPRRVTRGAMSPPMGVLKRPSQVTKTSSGKTRKLQSLAVLPFENAAGDPDAEYLSDGLTESIINQLSRIEGLRVVARSAVFRYKGKSADAITAGRELKVKAVVNGRVQLRDKTLLVRAELVEVAKEAQLWGEHYNRSITDIFAVQEEMATEIAKSLRLRLTGDDEERLKKRDTEDSDAYQAYLKGRYHWNRRTVEGLKQAVAHFEDAIAKDPNYALAFTGLADTYNILGYYNNRPPTEVYPKGKTAAARAIAIDGSFAEAHASLGYASLFFDWDAAAAHQHFRRAIELNPGYATAHHWYAWYLFAVDRFGEAVDELRLAQEMDPLSLIINDHLGYALLRAGRAEEAHQQLLATLELDASFPWTYWRLGEVHDALGRPEESIAAFRKVVELTGGGVGLGWLGNAQARSGDTDAARDVLRRLDARRAASYVSPLEFALVHAGLGELDETFAALDGAVRDRASDLARVKLLPWTESVRRDPRFAATLRTIGLST